MTEKRNLAREIIEGLQELKAGGGKEIQIEADIDNEYVPFLIEDFITNPVALERIRRGVTQKQLAKLLNCSLAYIKQLESSEYVPDDILASVKDAMKNRPDKWQTE